MTNNTIPNVPRELLERVLDYDGAVAIRQNARHELRAILSAPLPAGVDGLEVVATLLIDDPTDQECGDWDIEVESKVAERMSEHGGGQHELCRLSDATAIIDGLRGEVERLQFSLEVAKTDELSAAVYAETESIKHSLWDAEKERDQQAQRIGELERLLRGSRKHVAYAADHCEQAGMELDSIDAAMSAGKDSD